MPQNDSRALVCFFSSPAPDSAVSRAAHRLAEKLSAPLCAIVPAAPYSADYSEAMAQSRKDLQDGTRPAIQGDAPALGGVDTVYLIYPNYWGTVPMAVLTFLENLDLTGKTIAPLCVHEGGGLGQSVRDIQKSCPGAQVLDGLALEAGQIGDDAPLDAWLKSIGNLSGDAEDSHSRALIAYFSRAGENYVGGQLQVLSQGNTARAAQCLAEIIGADTFEIAMASPYSSDYAQCTRQAKADQQASARPALLSFPDSLAPYSVIYLGYPNYWGTVPMAVLTFLEHFDFSGKCIRPFCTHEGGGLGHSIADIRKACPSAQVLDGLALPGADFDEGMIRDWAQRG